MRPDEDFAMDWELGERAAKPVNEIAKAAKGAKAVYLATDPDREGEAIAWHILEVLRDKKAVKSTPIHRVTFNEITKQTVLDAIAKPRDIDSNLVDAYMRRRALDYLVGFSLSPVLWRKLPGAKSAGRVQLIALRLICERETEIESFKSQEYWTIEATFKTEKGGIITAQLTHLDGKKLDKFALQTEAEAQAAPPPIRFPIRWRRSKRSRRSATPTRLSPRRRCSRKPRASSGSARRGRCASRKNFMKAWTSAAIRWALSPICVPTAPIFPMMPSRARAT